MRHSKPNRANGICWQASQPGKDQCVAEIHLARDHMTLETIAHECSHAAWHRTRLQGLPLSDEDFQDYLANATGILVDVLLAWLSKENITVKLNVVPQRKVVTVKA